MIVKNEDWIKVVKLCMTAKWLVEGLNLWLL